MITLVDTPESSSCRESIQSSVCASRTATNTTSIAIVAAISVTNITHAAGLAPMRASHQVTARHATEVMPRIQGLYATPNSSRNCEKYTPNDSTPAPAATPIRHTISAPVTRPASGPSAFVVRPYSPPLVE